MCTNVLLCLNTSIAERLCKEQYGAMFQQGICVKMKIPTGTQERESSGICKTSKEKQRQTGRQRRRWLAEGKGVDGHESRNLTEIQIQETPQKKTRCSNFVPRDKKNNQVRIM